MQHDCTIIFFIFFSVSSFAKKRHFVNFFFPCPLTRIVSFTISQYTPSFSQLYSTVHRTHNSHWIGDIFKELLPFWRSVSFLDTVHWMGNMFRGRKKEAWVGQGVRRRILLLNSHRGTWNLR